MSINGFINYNKAIGLSSHSAMAAVRRLLHIKTGHAGTLDPAAHGVLPLCVGKATRLAEYLMEETKSYRGEFTLGIETHSYDAQGKIISEKDASAIKEEDILKILPDFSGEIWQKPPMVSALKIQGQPLYKLTREGREIELSPRLIKINSIKYLGGSFNKPNPSFEMEINCSKGTYIRSLAHDIGQSLGVGGHLSALCRIRVGNFLLQEAYTLEDIQNMVAENNYDFIFPIERALSHMAMLTVREDMLFKLLNGNEIPWLETPPLENCLIKSEGGEFLGVGRVFYKDAENQSLTLKMKKVLAGG